MGGVPVKRIKSIEEFIDKRSKLEKINDIDLIWKIFEEQHSK